MIQLKDIEPGYYWCEGSYRRQPYIAMVFRDTEWTGDLRIRLFGDDRSYPLEDAFLRGTIEVLQRIPEYVRPPSMTGVDVPHN